MAQVPVAELPERFPLAVDPSNRDETTNKDARLVNGYVERKGQGEFQVYRRPGYLTVATYTITPGAGLGIYNWNFSIYAVVGSQLYKDGVALGAVATASGTPYTFSSILGAVPKLVLHNFDASYSYSPSTGLVPMAGAVPPIGAVPGWAYIDGTLYWLSGTAQVRGSGINDVATWDGLNFLTAQIEPDGGVAIAKHLVYAIVFKQWTTEVFYDAGNPAGSPLAPVQGAKIQYGCGSANTVQDIDGSLFWLGVTRSGACQILMMKDLKVAVISTKSIERLLLFETFISVASWSYKGGGHSFYVITFRDLNLTLAYDISEGFWSQWTDTNGNYLPISGSTFSGTVCLLQHETNGKTFAMLPIYNTDDGALTTWELYTPNFDAGVDRKKMLNVLRLNADTTPGSLVTVRSNDYDYDPTKWSNPRTFDLSRQRPILVNCGTFYRRAYHLSHRGDQRLRISSLDMQLALGTL